MRSISQRILLSLSLAASMGVLTYAPSSARADADSALAYGLMVGELGTAGVLALNFGVKGWPKKGPALLLNYAPLVLGPAVAVGAHYTDLDPRPAYAIQGASMLGFDLYLIGALIDGRNQRDGVRAGPTALTLAAVGAAAGAWIGATEVEGEEAPVFYLAPTGGLLLGGFLGFVSGALGTRAGDKATHWGMLGAAAGMAVGLGVGIVYAFTHDNDAESAVAKPSQSSRLRVGGTPQRVIFSFGGAF